MRLLLHAGATILLPISVADEPARPGGRGDRPGTDGASSYTVKRGDTLNEVADDHDGAPGRHPDIVEAPAHRSRPHRTRLDPHPARRRRARRQSPSRHHG
ncbi:hypothetical protein HGK34_20985 [Myceligenerans sp. I2]|uniref:LysM domain-containing protein n=1 Tax=Myceligenerans indicum TaxID=2593663 RepID=A0ABS1LR07_9MICO|nr:hypothetical protein [Myceligenerans indicum]